MSEFFLDIFVGPQPDEGVSAARRLSVRRNKRATSERHINYMLKRTEPSGEKAGFTREQVPGLALLAELGAEIRGFWWTGQRCFVVAGAKLYELFAGMTFAERGTLLTSTGRVEMAQGLFSLVVVDGPYGYTLTLASNAFGRITDPDFYGSHRVSFLDGKFIFVRPETQQFYWSEAVDAADDYDALDFASAESFPDKIVSHIVDHREVWFAGERSIEVWVPAPGSDQVYARNSGVTIEVGCAATHTLQQVDNSVVWVGNDKHGQGIVWIAGGGNGYTPTRISDNSIEDALSQIEDMSGAYAWTYQDAGQTFYVLQIPGAETSWVWDASTRKWHERAEFAGGELSLWRASSHVFAFGRHLVGDAAGVVYEIDADEYTYAGDPIYREWTTPHYIEADMVAVKYHWVHLDITAGETSSGIDPQMEMCYYNDGGSKPSTWKARSTGKIGEYSKKVKWHRCGEGVDRVFKFRTTADAKVSIMGIAMAKERRRR